MTNWLHVPAVTFSGATTPNQAGFAAGTGTLDLRAEIAPVSWTSGFQSLLNQYAASGGSGSRFWFGTTPGGTLELDFFDATNGTVIVGSVAHGFAGGFRVWVRVLLNIAAHTCDFYTSPDGVTWTSLGTQQTGLATTSMSTAGSPSGCRIGTDADADNFVGDIYSTEVLVGGSSKVKQGWTTASTGTGPWTGLDGESWTVLGSAIVQGSTTRNATLTDAGTSTDTYTASRRTVVVEPAAVLSSATTLGCGVHEVFVLPRGGAPPDPIEVGFVRHAAVGQMLWTSLKYNLPLSDTGQFELILEGVSGISGGAACCAMLSGVLPWDHEVMVLRDGVVTFVGPITQILYDADKVTIRARDLTAWFDKRFVHDSLGPFNYSSADFADVATIQAFVAESALLPDISPQICGLKGKGKNGNVIPPTGTYPIGYQVNQSEYKKAGVVLRDLAKMGSDFRIRHTTRELLLGVQGDAFVHTSDGYGFASSTFRSTAGWAASGGSLSITSGRLVWTIGGAGTYTLTTTLRGLRAGRPHNFSVQAFAEGISPQVWTAYALADNVDQGPDYGVPLSISGNFIPMQVQSIPASSEVTYTIVVVINAAVTFDFASPQTSEFWPAMELVDESFITTPQVLLDGLSQVNRQLMLGQGAGTAGGGVQGEAPLPYGAQFQPVGLANAPQFGITGVFDYPALTPLQARDGLLEEVTSDSTLPDNDSADRAALSRYNVLSQAPLSITNAPLASGAQFAAQPSSLVTGTTEPTQADIRSLVPGNYCLVALSQVCQPFTGYLRIQNVAFDCGPAEVVTLSLISPRDV